MVIFKNKTSGSKYESSSDNDEMEEEPLIVLKNTLEQACSNQNVPFGQIANKLDDAVTAHTYVYSRIYTQSGSNDKWILKT